MPSGCLQSHGSAYRLPASYNPPLSDLAPLKDLASIGTAHLGIRRFCFLCPLLFPSFRGSSFERAILAGRAGRSTGWPAPRIRVARFPEVTARLMRPTSRRGVLTNHERRRL